MRETDYWGTEWGEHRSVEGVLKEDLHSEILKDTGGIYKDTKGMVKLWSLGWTYTHCCI